MSNIDYGYDEMLGPNDVMKLHGARLERPFPTAQGEWVLVDYDHSPVEMHHVVQLIDESGEPVRGVWVMFGFPGGDGNDYGHLYPDMNYWRGSPQVLRGNAQQTSGGGEARHTFASGGEDIWVWDVYDNEQGYSVLELPSAIVRNNLWIGPKKGGINNHTGAKLVFQRRKTGVVPDEQRFESLESRVAALENQVGV